MVNGILTFKTAYSDGDFTINWVDAISIRSEEFYIIIFNILVPYNGS